MSNKKEGKLKKQITEKKEELAVLQEKVEKKKLEIAGLAYDLGQLT